MENEIFTLYNRLTLRYGDVVSYATAADAVYHVKEHLQMGHLNLDHYELCSIGLIDIATGSITKSYPPRRIPWTDSLPGLSPTAVSSSSDAAAPFAAAPSSSDAAAPFAAAPSSEVSSLSS